MRKFALIIGINYTGESYALNGSVSDANRYKDFLLNHCGFTESDIMFITDDADIKPTYQNIITGFSYLRYYSRNLGYDEIWMYYSGHGSQVIDSLTPTYADEVDQKDEVIIPIDYIDSGIISDDTIHASIIQTLPLNTKFISVFDCCHSGTMLDINHLYKPGNIYEMYPEKYAGASETAGQIICISSSIDAQVSFETEGLFAKGEYSGALTWGLLTLFDKYGYSIRYKTILTDLAEMFAENGFSQTPQITTNKPINIYDHFLYKDSTGFINV